MNRRPLFNRKYAVIGRKAALEEAKSRSVKKDAEGFEDVEEFFKIDDDLENRIASLNRSGKSGGRKSLPRTVQPTSMGFISEYHQPLADDGMAESFDIEMAEPTEPVHENGQSAEFTEFFADSGPAFYPENGLKTPTKEENDSEISFSSAVRLNTKQKQQKEEPRRQKSPLAASGRKSTGSANPQQSKAAAVAKRKRRSTFKPLIKIRDEIEDDDENDENGHSRRSRRERFPPLQFWRNEKVVYGRRESVGFPVITKVLKKDQESAPHPQARRRGRRPKASPSSLSSKKTSNLKDAGFVHRLKATIPVPNYETGRTEKRVLAISQDQLSPEPVPKESFSIQTVFHEGSFVSAGALTFPPGSAKPTRNSAGHSLVFVVVQGTFEVVIHETSILVGSGSMFCVPRGTLYSIRSTWPDGEGTLYFCHCKDNVNNEN